MPWTAAATTHFQRQVALLRKTAGDIATDGRAVDDPATSELAAIAHAQSSLCAARHWLGDLPQAEKDCLLARADHLRAGLEPDHPEVFMALGDSRLDRYRATLARLQPRLERLRTSGDHELYALALWFAGIAEARLGRHREAERMYARLVDVRRAQAGARAKSMQLAWALSAHGGVLLTLGESTRGRAQLEQAARMFGELGGADHPHRQAPLILLARHELALGRWQQARDLAQPAYAALLPATSWQNWTIYAALAAMPAHARLGDAAAARAIMAAFDDLAAQGLDRDFPYLREDHWTSYATTWLALGEPAKAKQEIERLRGLLREPDASQLLPAKLACFDAELALASGDTGAARSLAQRCRDRYAAVLPAASPLLAWPDRLLAKTVVSTSIAAKAGIEPDARTAAP